MLSVGRRSQSWQISCIPWSTLRRECPCWAEDNCIEVTSYSNDWKAKNLDTSNSKDVQAIASSSAQYHRCNVMKVIPDESAGALVAPGNQKCLGRKKRGGLGIGLFTVSSEGCSSVDSMTPAAAAHSLLLPHNNTPRVLSKTILACLFFS